MALLKGFKKNKSQDELRILEKKISYKFKDRRYLLQGLTHRSAVVGIKDGKHNERFEFIGDSLLSIYFTRKLSKEYPNYDEGKLSKLRAYFVGAERLLEVAYSLELQKFVICDSREKYSNFARSKSILSDAVEAIIGAVYVDMKCPTDLKIVFKVIEACYSGIKNTIDDFSEVEDSRGRLQEFFQEKFKKLPDYKVVEEKGPEHNKLFKTEVSFDGKILGVGFGESKKTSAKNAAQKALENVKNFADVE